MSGSIGTEWPRVRADLAVAIEAYRKIGAPGAFGLMMLQDLARRADEAWAAQDTIAMLPIFEEMKEVKL